jgi:hypothetical protein
MNKRFDPALFKNNDPRARTKVASWLIGRGKVTSVRDNSDRYGPDLLMYSGGRFVGYAEVEVKRVWTSFEFPWDEWVQFPARKKKFVDKALAEGKQIFFFMLNKYMTRLIVFPGEALADSAIEEVSNREVRSGEGFYKVPFSRHIFQGELRDENTTPKAQ